MLLSELVPQHVAFQVEGGVGGCRAVWCVKSRDLLQPGLALGQRILAVEEFSWFVIDEVVHKNGSEVARLGLHDVVDDSPV